MKLEIQKLKGVSREKILKDSLKAILFFIILYISVYSSYFFITHSSHETKNHIGTIISKSSDEVAIKHGSQTELYLNIQFDDIGFKSIEVEPTTYFGHKVGDRVSFGLRVSKGLEFHVYFIIGFFVIFISLFLLFVIFIRWLFDIRG